MGKRALLRRIDAGKQGQGPAIAERGRITFDGLAGGAWPVIDNRKKIVQLSITQIGWIGCSWEPPAFPKAGRDPSQHKPGRAICCSQVPVFQPRFCCVDATDATTRMQTQLQHRDCFFLAVRRNRRNRRKNAGHCQQKV